VPVAVHICEPHSPSARTRAQKKRVDSCGPWQPQPQLHSRSSAAAALQPQLFSRSSAAAAAAAVAAVLRTALQPRCSRRHAAAATLQ
jgi:hypothetical protein